MHRCSNTISNIYKLSDEKNGSENDVYALFASHELNSTLVGEWDIGVNGVTAGIHVFTTKRPNFPGVSICINTI